MERKEEISDSGKVEEEASADEEEDSTEDEEQEEQGTITSCSCSYCELFFPPRITVLLNKHTHTHTKQTKSINYIFSDKTRQTAFIHFKTVLEIRLQC